jgi:hypothetical protein
MVFGKKRRYMKSIKTILVFLCIILTFNSCSTTRKRNVHKRDIKTKLSKYSDVIDLNRSEIYLDGAGYYFFNSSEPLINLSLYLRPDHNNREIIIGIRDDLIAFFGTNYWEARRMYNYPKKISIDFVLEENGKIKKIYNLYHFSDLHRGEYEWYERWQDDSQDSPGVAFMRRFIRNKEFDTFLENHADILNIEHSSGFSSGTGFIRMTFYFIIDDPRKIIRKIENDLNDFFNTYHETLAEEYGSFDRIDIIFYNNSEARIGKWISFVHAEEYQWNGKRWSW